MIWIVGGASFVGGFVVGAYWLWMRRRDIFEMGRAHGIEAGLRAREVQRPREKA